MKKTWIMLSLLTGWLLLGTSRQGIYAQGKDKESAQIEFMDFCAQFSDYSYVDWVKMEENDVLQYKAEWDSGIDSLMKAVDFPNEMAAEYWNTLMNAKALVHRQSIPLRSFASDTVTAALDDLEKGFDEVFVKMVSQEYYMRLFPDCFDEIIPRKLEKLIVALRKESR